MVTLFLRQSENGKQVLLSHFLRQLPQKKRMLTERWKL